MATFLLYSVWDEFFHLNGFCPEMVPNVSYSREFAGVFTMRESGGFYKPCTTCFEVK